MKTRRVFLESALSIFGFSFLPSFGLLAEETDPLVFPTEFTKKGSYGYFCPVKEPLELIEARVVFWTKKPRYEQCCACGKNKKQTQPNFVDLTDPDGLIYRKCVCDECMVIAKKLLPSDKFMIDKW